MRKLSLALIALLFFSSLGLADQPARDSETQQGQAVETPQVAKVKAQVQKRGVGEKSKVRVTLGSGTMVKGYISKVGESSFEVNGNTTGQATSISYTDVRKIQGPGLSKAAKVGIVVAVGVAIVALVIGIEYARTKL
jgi:hypothetical protein